MRVPFIAGNWKMFKTVHQAVVFVKELKILVKDVTDVEIVVAPAFTAVHAAAEAARNTNIGIAAQDVYWEGEGAFTGEVSPAMIKEAGAQYVIVGHSERRRLARIPGRPHTTGSRGIKREVVSGFSRTYKL